MFIARTLLVLIILLPTLAAGAVPQRIQAASRITAVTVYPDRALTTRSATVSVKPGSYTVVFEGLPALIQDDSVRVTGRGSAGATILGLEVKRLFMEQVPGKRAVELEQEIRVQERAFGGLESRKTALAAQKKFIESIKVAWGERISRELAVGKPTGPELNEAMTFISDGMTKVEEQTRDIDQEQLRLRERIDALRRQRDEVIGSGRKETTGVEVEIEVVREGQLVLELSGVTPAAGWEPSYDVRLAADGASAELTFRAQVLQQTGEDWQGVALSLSTARPAVGGAPPELTPWHVSFYRPPEIRPMAAAPMMKREDSARFRAESVLAGSVPHASSSVAEEINSVTFQVQRPVDIPSDGTRHATVVAMEQLPLTLEFLTVPKLAPVVFLTSRIVNPAGYPLLPGKINIFTGSTFSGSSIMKKTAAGETFDLFFGPDDQVKVKRDELKSHKEAGLFGKNRMVYRYRIELQNFRKQDQTVTVRDQVPLADNEEIKVSLENPSQKPDQVKADGSIEWKLPLKAGEKRGITFEIVVEYPKEREIQGL